MAKVSRGLEIFEKVYGEGSWFLLMIRFKFCTSLFKILTDKQLDVILKRLFLRPIH